MAMQPYGLTQFNPMQVDQARAQNRLRTLRADQAEMEMERQNRLMDLLGGGGSSGGSSGGQRQSGNRLRNAAMEAGGGPTKRAASMIDQAQPAARTGGGMDQSRIMEIMALDPQLGSRIQEMRAGQAEAQRVQEDQEAAIIARFGDRLQGVEGPQREQVWQNLKQRAAQRGYDVSDWPETPDENYFTVARARAQSADMYEPPEQGQAPKTVGGMQWNAEAQRFEPIPGYVEQKERVASAGAPRTTVDMGERETAYQKSRGGQAAERYAEIQKTARQATNDMQAMRGIEQYLNEFETGNLAGVKLTANQVARDLGIPEDYRQYVPGGLSDRELAAGETIRNLSSGLVFGALQNFSGAISEGERAYVERVTPGLTTTPQGIRQIARIRERISERAETKARLADEWEAEYGGLHRRDEKNRSFQSMWRDYVNNNPLISEDNKDAISDLASKSAPDTRLVDPDQVKTIDGQRYIKIGDAWYEG
jgi:hypothetical protein